MNTSNYNSSHKEKRTPKEDNPFCNKSELSYYLHDFINRKSFKEPSVYKAAEIEKNTWCNIYSGFSCPDPLTARKLVIGLQASLDEASSILQQCGYSFSNSSFDQCIIKCLEKGIHAWADVLDYIQNNAPEYLDKRFKKLKKEFGTYN